jgi:ribosomal protein S10
MEKKYLIILKSVNIKTLVYYKIFLNTIFKKLDIKSKYFFIKKKNKKITLIKSPHVKKKNKETFMITTHKLCFCFNSKSSKLNSITKYLLQNKPKSIQMVFKF